MSPVVRKMVTIIFMVVTIFVLIWGITYFRQYKFFQEAEKFKSQQRSLDAIARYECAIRMYTPGSSLVRKSIENIWLYGESFQHQKRFEEALIAYRSIQTSLYAIRSFYSPFLDWRTKAENRIADLLAVADDNAKTGVTDRTENKSPSPE